MDQLTLFFLDDAFSFANVDQRLDVVRGVVWFFLGGSFFHLLLLAQPIERTMPWLSRESESAIERAQYWQEP